MEYLLLTISDPAKLESHRDDDTKVEYNPHAGIMKPRYTIYVFKKEEIEPALAAEQRSFTLEVVAESSAAGDSSGAQPAGAIRLTYVHVRIVKAE